jgi:DnaK suppressor protein
MTKKGDYSIYGQALINIKDHSCFWGATSSSRSVCMDQEKTLYFKRHLEGMLHSLLEEAGKTCNDMRQDYNGELPDPTDRASLESDRNFLLRIKDRERKLITKIKEAMERIDNGTFGVCDSCGKAISKKRLMARPVTTLCIECKTEGETQERSERLRRTKHKSSFPS